MRSSFLLAILLLTLASCTGENAAAVFNNIQTNQLDSLEYEGLKQDLGFWEVSKASPYLGGLSSKASFAYGYAMCGDPSYCQDSQWQDGGFICTCRNLIIKRGEEIDIIKNRFELQRAYAPIGSREEALGYAILMTGNYPIFSKDYFKDEYRYFNAKPKPTAVQEFSGYYLVQLFDYEVFGCDHPYYVVLVRVDKNGDVSEHRRQKAFEDPEEDGLCRD